ncbi:MAG: acyl-CoA dehydrogenase [Micavibrio aeruginosavorus]|uniref:3-methylmercaptopropionyl-CoA dehydrogenase n=1 Tax=Micavibrio aeruginosavorus TaxID=349221 RepID=A0A2W5HDN9_9BACT|nr:MAG: acyl-CoA dehydrogenase [Micavibrio aeruginosavorus]
MPDYTPPIEDMKFLLSSVTRLDALKRDDLDASMVEAILEEAGKLASGVLAPLNAVGDKTPAKVQDGVVTTSPGFKDAYKQYCDGGWNAVPFDPDFGGQGLPWVMSFPVQEMWQAANMAFGLCPLLNQGAVDAIHTWGTDEQKETYLAKLISGEWTGTMNLTEPQAGSDLALLRSKAVPNNDGTYRIYGQKIFITYGEHDFTDNIIHLVLARLPDAPEGTRGISLFLVPKFLGQDGKRNDLKCVSLEHKLGIHGSPTATMSFGDTDGAIGYLLGKENEGLKCMFTMMNNARLSVGLQGVAIADRALQAAIAYAKDRKQGKPLAGGDTVTISEHPDIRRMILSMSSQVEAARALAYEAALHLDLARAGDKQAQGLVDLLTPVVKAWGTDIACEVTSTAVQVHGGMGFIEETGVAQYYRDARILPIYEGTNGIQANDLVFRKVLRDSGAAALAWIAQSREQVKSYTDKSLGVALDQLEEATRYIVDNTKDPDVLAAIAVPYLKLFGITAGGVMLARSVLALQSEDDFARRKKAKAEFYIAHILSQSTGLLIAINSGSNAVLLEDLI